MKAQQSNWKSCRFGVLSTLHQTDPFAPTHGSKLQLMCHLEVHPNLLVQAIDRSLVIVQNVSRCSLLSLLLLLLQYLLIRIVTCQTMYDSVKNLHPLPLPLDFFVFQRRWCKSCRPKHCVFSVNTKPLRSQTGDFAGRTQALSTEALAITYEGIF